MTCGRAGPLNRGLRTASRQLWAWQVCSSDEPQPCPYQAAVAAVAPLCSIPHGADRRPFDLMILQPAGTPTRVTWLNTYY